MKRILLYSKRNGSRPQAGHALRFALSSLTRTQFGMSLIFATLTVLTGIARSGEGGTAPVLVRTAAVQPMSFRETLAADGTIAAKHFSLVSPRVSGTLDDVYVREGDRLTKGETLLFQVDNVKLRYALTMQMHDLDLARSALEERSAALESATVDARQAEREFTRNSRLHESGVVTLSDLEQCEAKLDQLLAVQKVNSLQVALAQKTLERQVVAVELAAKELNDSIVLAPLSGVVSRRLAEPGEMGSPGQPVVRIDDVDDLKAVAYLPGEVYPRVKTGVTRVQLSVNGKHIGVFPVSYKSPAIDAAYRTFEIWVDVPGDQECVVPGAPCVAGVIVREESGLGVPKNALQRRDGKYWLFVPRDGRAVRTEVKPGLEQNGWVELREPSLTSGQAVVVEGQFLLDDGVPIRE